VVSAVERAGRAERAWEAAASVVDPELPMLTLADLGVLADVELEGERVVVWITPTYTGCPAVATIRADVRLALAAAGFTDVEVRTRLSPPWSSDRISERGRDRLRQHGMAPPEPGAARDERGDGPVDVLLLTRRAATCPRCGSVDTGEVSRFGPTACTAIHVCAGCGEPFEKVKER
jgi:ring-1,2-phenylacetyl-CoA epoxidase subunit PaaD